MNDKKEVAALRKEVAQMHKAIGAFTQTLAKREAAIADLTNAILHPDGRDDLYKKVKGVVKKRGRATTAFLQDTFKIGYSKAAQMIDLLKEDRVIKR